VAQASCSTRPSFDTSGIFDRSISFIPFGGVELCGLVLRKLAPGLHIEGFGAPQTTKHRSPRRQTSGTAELTWNNAAPRTAAQKSVAEVESTTFAGEDTLTNIRTLHFSTQLQVCAQHKTAASLCVCHR